MTSRYEFVDLPVDKSQWIDLWDQSVDQTIGISDIHIDSMDATIGDLRSKYNKPARKDQVLELDHAHPMVSNLLQTIRDKWGHLVIGRVALFMQHGEDVPVHSDAPYRTGAMLNVPLYGYGVTYYVEPLEEVVITQPCVMDVIAPHGIKDITDDRLCLHVEFPQSEVADFN